MMTRVNRISRLVLVVFVGIVPATFAGEDMMTATARKLYKTHQPAIVRVSITISVDIKAVGIALKNNAMKKTVGLTGTVIDKSGLVVIGNPSPDASRAGIPESIGGHKIDVQVKMSDAKIILEDGTEIDGTIVLKDPDNGIAFLLPSRQEDAKAFEKLATFSSLPTAKADLLSEIVVLGRSLQMDDSVWVRLGRLCAVTEKPRRRYYSHGTSIGSPNFSADGKILGITSGATGNPIIPFAEVLEVAKQAVSNKKAEDKKEEKGS